MYFFHKTFKFPFTRVYIKLQCVTFFDFYKVSDLRNISCILHLQFELPCKKYYVSYMKKKKQIL